MTVVHNLRTSSDQDFKFLVNWTRNGVPVEVTAARVVVTIAGVDTEIGSMVDGQVIQTDDEISVVVPQASLPDWEPGQGTYVLAVETLSGERVRLVEGGLAIQAKAVSW